MKLRSAFVLTVTIALPPVAFGAACATEKAACAADKKDCDGDKSCDPAGGPHARAGKHGGGPQGGMHGGGMHGGGMHGGQGAGMACPMDGGASSTALPQGVNAVQNEMRLLNHAVHKSMTLAALGELSMIPALFHEVHQARGLTDKALADGSWKPAKGDLAAFKQMDAAFHGELEKLVKAAQAKDQAAVVEQLDRLLPSCVACHAAHREPGLPAGMKAMMPAAPPAGAEHPAGEHPAGAEHPKH